MPARRRARRPVTGDAPPASLVRLRLDGFDTLPLGELGGELLDQPWGPELRLTDPDGNRLRLGPTSGGERAEGNAPGSGLRHG